MNKIFMKFSQNAKKIKQVEKNFYENKYCFK